MCGVSSVLSSNTFGRCEGNNRDAVLRRSFVADCVEIASPSVVNIQVQVTSGFSSGMSTGSGFVITRDGFIVTNAHVVREKGANCNITMWDGRKRRGVVHSLDPSSDVALVQMLDVDSHEDLPLAKLGSSASLRAGEFERLIPCKTTPFLLSLYCSGNVLTQSFYSDSACAQPVADVILCAVCGKCRFGEAIASRLATAVVCAKRRTRQQVAEVKARTRQREEEEAREAAAVDEAQMYHETGKRRVCWRW